MVNIFMGLCSIFPFFFEAHGSADHLFLYMNIFIETRTHIQTRENLVGWRVGLSSNTGLVSAILVSP